MKTKSSDSRFKGVVLEIDATGSLRGRYVSETEEVVPKSLRLHVNVVTLNNVTSKDLDLSPRTLRGEHR